MDDQLYDVHEQLDDTFWWFVGRRAVIREVLKKYLPAASGTRRIIDVGCGGGGNLLMLREFGEVMGLDASERVLAGARARVGDDVPLVLGQFPSSLPEDARFDVITALDVIEHLDDPVSLLQAARERLNAGGRLVVTVPAFPFLWSVHDELNHHRRRYVRSTLLEHLSQGGFTVEWVSYFNSVLFPLIAGARLARKVLPLKAETSDAVAPPKGVNALLAQLFSAERHVVSRLQVPFGVSLIAIARPA